VIRTALLSFGMSGKLFHAPFIQAHPGFELAGAWERSKPLMQQHYPTVKSYGSLQQILADDEVQLVVVNTPNATHYEYTKMALEAGKDVVVEKAFTSTLAEAEALQQLAQKLGRKLSVYHSRRYDSDCRTVQKIVAQKLLGEIVEATFRYDRYKPQPGPKLHKEMPGPGAGLWFDLGPHLADQALHIFGKPQGLMADIRITRDAALTDDWFAVTLYYPHCRVNLKASNLVKEATAATELQGTLGSFIKPKGDVQEADLLNGMKPGSSRWGTEATSTYGQLFTTVNGKIVREKYPSEKGNYMDFYNAVQLALTQDKPLPVTATQAIAVMRLLELAVQSSQQKCYLAW
jgi:scyllo-inositol 2-dehydrogenase (NADP+)